MSIPSDAEPADDPPPRPRPRLKGLLLALGVGALLWGLALVVALVALRGL